MDQDDFLGDLLLTNDDILERVDEYSLYCHYLEYEPIPGTGRYRSPVRPDDEDPSFGIFYSKYSKTREFLWKDQALGITADIFKLVQLMFRYRTMEEAREKIIKDFHLRNSNVHDGDKIVFHDVPTTFTTEIRVKSRDFYTNEIKWWQDINIHLARLSKYNTTALQLYWLAKEQEIPYNAKPFTFAYRIWDKYKIYQPFADKRNKFRHNYTEEQVEGLNQLTFTHPLLVITKSLKDVMFFDSLDYEAIAPRSETTLIAPRILRALEQHYPRIVTFFDNDGKHKADEYPYPAIHIPSWIGEKDPTDVARYKSIEQAAALVNELLNSYR